MPKGDFVGEFELYVMLALARPETEGYGMNLRQAIEERTGRNIAIGAIYATLGEFDKAQEWIENAASDGFPNYAFFETDVHLDRLRATPRFRAFLSKLRQEWEHIPGESE